jgi:hypothetical protein
MKLPSFRPTDISNNNSRIAAAIFKEICNLVFSLYAAGVFKRALKSDKNN